MRDSQEKMYFRFFCKCGYLENRGGEFEYKNRENEDSNEMREFFSCLDIDHEDYLVCDSNVMTSDIMILSDLIDSESKSSNNDADDGEEDKIPSETKVIQALKTLKVFLSNRKAKIKTLEKHIYVEDAICDVDAKTRLKVRKLIS